MTLMTERQEVAEHLRHLTPSKHAHPDYTPWYTDICKAVGGKKDPWFGISALAERLADLIDPTCHMIMELEPDGIGAPHRYTIRCSNCGQLWGETDGALRAPDYCPYCGARVVSEDE